MKLLNSVLILTVMGIVTLTACGPDTKELDRKTQIVIRFNQAIAEGSDILIGDFLCEEYLSQIRYATEAVSQNKVPSFEDFQAMLSFAELLQLGPQTPEEIGEITCESVEDHDDQVRCTVTSASSTGELGSSSFKGYSAKFTIESDQICDIKAFEKLGN